MEKLKTQQPQKYQIMDSPSALSLEAIVLGLRQQHAFDLELYQTSHREWKNVWLHKALIPIETFSAVVFITTVWFHIFPLSDLLLTLLLVSTLGFGIGLTSLMIATANHPWAGVASFVFWVTSSMLACVVSRQKGISKDNAFVLRLLLASFSWILASTLQVVIGHWLWELNDPDLLSSNNHVSWLSLVHSVQIAWSS